MTLYTQGQENRIYSKRHMIIADIISITIMIPVIIPLVLYVAGYGAYYGWLFSGILIANVAAVGIKELTGRWSQRPIGATACDAFCIGPIVEGEPGFPSGHMTTIAMFISSLWFQFQDPKILYIGVPWVSAMGWARVAKRCHTWFQVAGGLILGVVAGYGLHRITARLL